MLRDRISFARSGAIILLVMSSSVDFDPLFLRGLRLLHSRARDSADQLRQLLDDVLAQKHSGGAPIAPLSLTISRDKTIATIKQDSDVKHSMSRKGSPKHSASDFQSSKLTYDEPKRKETEKRQFERLKQELSDLQGFEHSKYEHTKRARLDSPHSSSLSSSPSPQPLITVSKPETYSEPSTGSGSTYQETADSDTSDDTTDAEGFALQMGLTCIICKQLDVSLRNQLIECQECHNLYHQECHRPVVTEQEINDPRHVWYCAKCTKTMKKVTTKVQPKPVKATLPSLTPVPSRETFPVAKIVKPETTSASSLLPFKRTEIKAPVVQGSSVSSTSIANKPTGLASLAANLGARSTVPPSTLSGTPHPTLSKSGFGPSKSSTSASMLASKSMLAFPSLSALSAKPAAPVTTTQSPGKSGISLSGLASLANAAAVVSKSATSSSCSKHSSGSSSSLSRSATASSSVIASGNGGNGASGSSVGSKTAVSSSLMSADKRLQIMKKKAAAKMQEKRRLSSK